MKTPPRVPKDQARAAAATSGEIHTSGGSDPLRALAIVPARIGSTRLPRKMLLEAAGLPLFVHTARNAERCSALARVVVATDSEEVLSAAALHGVEAMKTSDQHQSGTDRVNEAYERLRDQGGHSYDVVVNVQGDEPELPPQQLEQLVAVFREPEVEVATLCAPLPDPAQLEDPAIVKVVRDGRGNALYFSRAPIPARAHTHAPSAAATPGWRHVGVYAFRPDALARFCALERGQLEAVESLEQLRWLEAGQSIRCLAVDRVAPGIDTQEQLDAFRKALESEARAVPASGQQSSEQGRN